MRVSVRSHWRETLLLFGDVAFFYLALWSALSLRHGRIVPGSFFLFHAYAFTGYLVLHLTTFYALGLYDPRQIRELFVLVQNLLITVPINWALGSTYFYFLSPYLGLTPKTHFLLTLAISHLVALIWRRMWLVLVSLRPLRQRVVFLGEGPELDGLREELEAKPEFGYVSGKGAQTDLVAADGRWIEENWELAKPVLSAALHGGVPIVSLTSFYESLYGKVSPEDAQSAAWMLDHVLPRSASLYVVIKRAVDMGLAAVVAVLGLPVLAVVALAIRLVDGAPVLYGQRRLGFLGMEFTLWKFRTMAVQGGLESPFTSGCEKKARITPLGRVLRRFRLDELPQLWNVLKGEMSLVGPRPEWVKEIEVLERVVPGYHLRHLVRPGVTGWAQIYFRATSDPVDSMEKLRYDLYYVKHLSLALDLSILLKTFKRAFRKDELMTGSTQRESLKPLAAYRRGADVAGLFGRN